MAVASAGVVSSQEGGNAAVTDTMAETATTEIATTIDASIAFVNNGLLRWLLISNNATTQRTITTIIARGHRAYVMMGISRILTLALDLKTLKVRSQSHRKVSTSFQ